MMSLAKLAKQLILYFAPVLLAVTLIYFVGLSPFLKAQQQIQNPSGAVSGSVQLQIDTNGKYQEQDLKQAEKDLLNKASVIPGNDHDSKNDLINNAIANTNPTFRTSKNDEFKYVGSYIGDMDAPERDPFRKPEEMLRREEDIARPKTPVVNTDEVIDSKMEAIRRWPLRDYKLIGVIWDVKNPKAMLVDKNKTKHLLKKNYRIGNKNGLVSEIGEGSITVLQEGVPIVLSLTGDDSD